MIPKRYNATVIVIYIFMMTTVVQNLTDGQVIKMLLYL